MTPIEPISDEQLAELEADANARSKLGIDQCEGGKRITRSYACSHCGAAPTDGCRRPLRKRYDDSRAVMALIARMRAAESLLAECRPVVAREVERWTRAAAIFPVNANVESSLLKRIDAAMERTP